jgi:hypothetical protein
MRHRRYNTTVNPARLVVVATEERRSLVNLSLDDFEVGSCTWHGVFWGLIAFSGSEIVFSGSEHTEDDLFVSGPVTISYSRSVVDGIGLSSPGEVRSEPPAVASVRSHCMPMGYSIVGPNKVSESKSDTARCVQKAAGGCQSALERRQTLRWTQQGGTGSQSPSGLNDRAARASTGKVRSGAGAEAACEGTCIRCLEPHIQRKNGADEPDRA